MAKNIVCWERAMALQSNHLCTWDFLAVEVFSTAFPTPSPTLGTVLRYECRLTNLQYVDLLSPFVAVLVYPASHFYCRRFSRSQTSLDWS